MKYATVDEMIKMLQEVSQQGYGDYEVACNQEYALARVGDSPEVTNNNGFKQVSYGGYS